MPGGKDIAALPTSWALTLWDALPIFLSVEGALSVLILALIGGTIRRRAWAASRHHLAAGVAYLALFDIRLAAGGAILGAAALAATSLAPPAEDTIQLPSSPGSALRSRLWELLGVVALAAATAAIIKILVGATIGTGSALWFPLAAVAGWFVPLSLGAGAVPALAIASSSGSTLVGLLWLFAAATRTTLPVAVAFVRHRRAHLRVDGRVNPTEDA